MKWLDPNWWKGLHKIIALEVPELESGDWKYLVLEKNQDSVKVIDSGSVTGREKLNVLLLIHKKIPVLLGLWSHYVFEKLLTEEFMDDPVGGIMGVSVDDSAEFSLQTFPAVNQQSRVALVRNERVSDLVGILGKEGKRVIGTCLSRASWLYYLPSLLPEAMEENLVLNLDGEKLCFQNGLLTEFKEIKDLNFREIDISRLETEVESHYLNLYAAVVAFWMQEKPEDAPLPLQEEYQEHCKTSRLQNMTVVLALFVGLWSIGLFSYRIQMERQKAELEYIYSQNLPVIKAISNLDDKIASRENLKVQLGTQTLVATRSSWYLDQLALHCPEQIKMSQVTYAPELDDFKQVGAREESEWDLIISGECKNSGPIANYSAGLESLDWVQQLKVFNSKKNFQTDTYQFVFLIRLGHV